MLFANACMFLLGVFVGEPLQALRNLVRGQKVSLMFDEFTDDQGNSLVAIIAQVLPCLDVGLLPFEI